MTESENSPLSEVGPGQPEGLSGGHPEPVIPVPLPAAPPAVPIGGGERLAALDLLRGFALCGILLMNIVNFAWPGGAYTNPNHPYFALDSIGEVPDPEVLEKKIAEDEKDLNRRQKDLKRLEREAETKPVWSGGELRWCAISSTADIVEYEFAHLLVENKMRTLFSMLFGAGVVLMADHTRGKKSQPGWLHYRRMFWLLVIGALHGYLLWTGDILFAYASVGLLLYPLRRWRARWLLLFGMGLFACPLLIAWFASPVVEWVRERGRAVAQTLPTPTIGKEAVIAQPHPENTAPDSTDTVAEEDIHWMDGLFLQGFRTLESNRRGGTKPESVTRDIRMHQTQSYLASVVERFWEMIWAQLAELCLVGFLGMGWPMVLGMGLMKLGFLSGGWRTATYGRVAIVGYGLGIPACWFAELYGLGGGSNLADTTRLIFPLESCAMLLVTLANASTVLWLWQTGRLGWMADRLGAAGRMALSNYLFDSLACTLIFAGFGLGLYGTVPRVGLAGLVVAIWVMQLLFSPWWLARYRFGPVEWLWRSLTYWRLQPMRVAVSPASV